MNGDLITTGRWEEPKLGRAGTIRGRNKRGKRDDRCARTRDAYYGKIDKNEKHVRGIVDSMISQLFEAFRIIDSGEMARAKIFIPSSKYDNLITTQK